MSATSIFRCKCGLDHKEIKMLQGSEPVRIQKVQKILITFPELSQTSKQVKTTLDDVAACLA